MKKYYLLLSAVALLGLSGCTPASSALVKPKTQTTQQLQDTQYEKPTVHKQALYQNTMRSVASGIKHDPNYKRMALDTPEKKEWFKNLTYRLWDRQITRHQFISEGLSRYPAHRYEFEFVVKGFESVCSAS
jgi:hypothetical protein